MAQTYTTTTIDASGKHVHLTQEAVEALFGKGAELTADKILGEHMDFRANEKVQLEGPNGVRIPCSILGPARKYCQVELSYTEARILGIKAPLSDSGKHEGTPGIRIIGPAGIVNLEKGVMIVRRHVHLSRPDAEILGVTDEDRVCVRVDGPRALFFDEVAVRVAPEHVVCTYSFMHVDYDEWNAAGLTPGVTGKVFRSDVFKDILE